MAPALFVYGTLMPGHLRWGILAPHARGHHPAAVVGTLYDTGQGWPSATFAGDAAPVGGRGRPLSRAVVPGWLVDLEPSTATTLLFSGFGLVVAIYWLATIIPSLAVTVRRLHDRGMSGWWYLGFVVISMIQLVGIVASIAFLVIMLLPGTPGPNRWGADPKDPSSAQVFA